MQNLTTQKNKSRLFLSILLLASVLLAIAFIMISRPTNLLVRAHKITDTAGWDERSNIYPLGFGHYWLSSSEILFARQRPHIHDGVDFYLYDTHTDATAKLTDFTKRMEAVSTMHGTIVSPDGKYLVGIGFHGLTADIVGITSKFRYSLEDGTCVWSWSPDSRYLVHFTSSEYPNYTLTPNTMTLQFIAINPNGSVSISKAVWKTGVKAVEVGNGATSSKGKYSFILPGEHEGDETENTIGVVETHLGTDATPDERFILPLPFEGEISDATLSSDGQQIALFVSRNVRYPWFQVLDSLWRRPRQFHRVTTLLAGNIHDRKLHMVGNIDATAEYQMYGPPGLHSLMWLPDNRHLSFDYGGAIWLTSVD